jgi:hypothetical protein
MKRILFFTLTLTTVALLGGCATDDYGHGDHDQSSHYEQPSSSPGGY